MRTTFGEPQGIGGWLLLPALGLVITPISLLLQLRNDVLPVLAPDVWKALTSPDSPAYHPLWAPLLAVEMIWNLGYLLFGFWLGWKFFTKSRQLPKLYIIGLALTLVMQIIDLRMMMLIPAAAAEITFPESYKDVARSAVQALIWIPYFLVSRRVSNTFVN